MTSSLNSNEFVKDNLIVNYLPPTMSESHLQELFEQFGKVVHLKIVHNHETKRSAGYGFVKFESESDAAVAMQHLNGYRIGKKIIKVSVARPSNANIKECKIYVTNLPQEYTKHEVGSLFSQFGQIVESRLLLDHRTGQSRSTAFIQFETKQEALNALSMNGRTLENSSRPLIVKFAEDHTNNGRNKQNMTYHQSHRVQPQLFYDNPMEKYGSYDRKRGNDRQQQMYFDMYSFYGGSQIPWVGIPPYYNFGMLPMNQPRPNQINSNNNKFRTASNLPGKNQIN